MVRKQLPNHLPLFSLECCVYYWCLLAHIHRGPGSSTIVIFGKPSLTLRSCLCLGFPALFHYIPQCCAPVWEQRLTLTFASLGDWDSTPHHVWMLFLGNRLAKDKRLTWVIIFFIWLITNHEGWSSYDAWSNISCSKDVPQDIER